MPTTGRTHESLHGRAGEKSHSTLRLLERIICTPPVAHLDDGGSCGTDGPPAGSYRQVLQIKTLDALPQWRPHPPLLHPHTATVSNPQSVSIYLSPPLAVFGFSSLT